MNRLVWFLEGRCVGKVNAKTRTEISGWLSVDVREVKKMAEEARLAGIPVCYSTDAKAGGLYLAANGAEIEESIEKLNRLAISILRERSALKRAKREAQERQVQKELFA